MNLSIKFKKEKDEGCGDNIMQGKIELKERRNVCLGFNAKLQFKSEEIRRIWLDYKSAFKGLRKLNNVGLKFKLLSNLLIIKHKR